MSADIIDFSAYRGNRADPLERCKSALEAVKDEIRLAHQSECVECMAGLAEVQAQKALDRLDNIQRELDNLVRLIEADCGGDRV